MAPETRTPSPESNKKQSVYIPRDMMVGGEIVSPTAVRIGEDMNQAYLRGWEAAMYSAHSKNVSEAEKYQNLLAIAVAAKQNGMTDAQVEAIFEALQVDTDKLRVASRLNQAQKATPGFNRNAARAAADARIKETFNAGMAAIAAAGEPIVPDWMRETQEMKRVEPDKKNNIRNLFGLFGRLKAIGAGAMDRLAQLRAQTQSEAGGSLGNGNSAGNSSSAEGLLYRPSAEAVSPPVMPDGMLYRPTPEQYGAPQAKSEMLYRPIPERKGILGRLKEKVQQIYAERGRLTPSEIMRLLRENPELRDSLVASGLVMTASALLAPTGLGVLLPMVGGAVALKWREGQIRGRELEVEELENFQRAMYGGLGQTGPETQRREAETQAQAQRIEDLQEKPTHLDKLKNFGARALRLLGRVAMAPERAATMALLQPNVILRRLENAKTFSQDIADDSEESTQSIEFGQLINNWEQETDPKKKLDRIQQAQQTLQDLISLKVMDFNVPTAWGEQLGGFLSRFSRNKDQAPRPDLQQQRKAKLQEAFKNWFDMANSGKSTANSKENWFIQKIDAVRGELQAAIAAKKEAGELNTKERALDSEEGQLLSALSDMKKMLESIRSENVELTLEQKARTFRNKVLYARMFGIVAKGALRAFPKSLQTVRDTYDFSVAGTKAPLNTEHFRNGINNLMDTQSPESVSLPDSLRAAQDRINQITRDAQEAAARRAQEAAAATQQLEDMRAQARNFRPIDQSGATLPNTPDTTTGINIIPNPPTTPVVEAPLNIPGYRPGESEWNNLVSLYDSSNASDRVKNGVVNLLKNSLDVNESVFTTLGRNASIPKLGEVMSYLDAQSGAPSFQELLNKSPELKAIWNLGRVSTADYMRSAAALTDMEVVRNLVNTTSPEAIDTLLTNVRNNTFFT